MKKNNIREILLINVLLFSFIYIQAQKTIEITDYGITPGTRINAASGIKKALGDCKDKGHVILNFPKGRYDLWPTYCEDKGARIGFFLESLKNVRIEGNGSEFIFHGYMQIALIENSENIEFCNFSIDWDRPFISQGQVTKATNEYLDIKVDKGLYPYFIEEGKLMFTGEEWKQPVIRHLIYDKVKKEIVHKTWDNPLGNIFNGKAEEIRDIIRLWGESKIQPEKGTYISLYHGNYVMDGIYIRNSKNTLLKDLKVYHALSNGVFGEMSENITMENASMTINEEKGRVFSIMSDASHFVNCKGLIKVENCNHTGQGDDFINVQGRNGMINKITGNRTIEIEARKNYNFACKGDEVWFINASTVQRGELRVVEMFTPVYSGGKITAYRIDFTSDIPQGYNIKDFVENKTWNPSVEIRNCHISKKHRARGILVATPGNVIIENNYFNNAGTAILLEGDVDYWFESGALTNMKIQNNIFDNCLTSGNSDGDRWKWGDAVITITPSHHPTDTSEPYHRNIQIINNVFKVFDAPLVRARSVRNLSFVGNEIYKTNLYPSYTWQKSAFLLDGCRDVFIKDNIYDKNYKTRSILIEHMKKQDVKFEKNKDFTINYIPKDFNTYFNKPRY